MKNNKNIIKQFFQSLIITSTLLSIISTSTIYFIQKDKFHQTLADEITYHIKTGLEKDIKVLSEEFIGHVKKINFTLFELYDDKQKNVHSFSQAVENTKSINFIKKQHNKIKHMFPLNKKTYYDFIEAPNKQYYILVFHPIYKNDKLLGYVEGVKKIEKNIIEEFEKKIRYTILIILTSIIVFSIFIFPLIYLAYKKINENRIELISNNIMTINTLGNAIALRDSDTNEHNYRVAIYSIRLAQELNIGKEQIEKLIIGSFLHDIGKIGISDSVLLKNGKLTHAEFESMKQHVQKGIKIIEDDKWLENGRDVILYHHEKYDGSGYPNRIEGENIPNIARIFAIVDVFDALTSKRPYKEPFSYEKAIKILKESSGTHFDPQILESFLKISYRLYIDISNESHQQLKDELDNSIKRYFLDSL